MLQFSAINMEARTCLYGFGVKDRKRERRMRGMGCGLCGMWCGVLCAAYGMCGARARCGAGCGVWVRVRGAWCGCEVILWASKKDSCHLERSYLLLLCGIGYNVVKWSRCELKRDLLYFFNICNNIISVHINANPMEQYF